jgi:four helix bundle protein
MEQVTNNKRVNPLYKNLALYAEAHELVLAVYRKTQAFPKSELFGLVSQMRRCVVSVVANFVEGYGRRTRKDTLQFLYIARGSLNELEYYLDLSLELGYLTESDYEELICRRAVVGKLLSGFIKSVDR